MTNYDVHAPVIGRNVVTWRSPLSNGERTMCSG